MSRVPINTLLFLSRRTYSVAASETSARVPSAAALPRAAKTSTTAESGTKQETIYWMRDPETGYWVPENQIGDADPADLRAKLLSKKY